MATLNIKGPVQELKALLAKHKAIMSQVNKWSVSCLKEPLTVAAISLAILLSLRIFLFLQKQWRLRKMYRHLSSLPTSLLLGSLLGHVEHFWRSRTHLPLTVFLANVAFGVGKVAHSFEEGVVYFRIGPFRHLVACFSANAAEAILRNPQNIAKAVEYDFVVPWLGDGLLLSKGAHWKLHRKLLTPTFHFAILNKFIPVMNYQMRTFMQILDSRMDSNGRTRIEDVRPLVTNCTLDIICQTAMGVEMNAQKAWSQLSSGESKKTPESEYTDAIRVYFEGIINRLSKPWLYLNFIFNLSPDGRQRQKAVSIMHNFTNKVIHRRKDEMKLKFDRNLSVEESMKKISEGSRMDFLDLMLVYHLKGDDEFNLVSIREEVDTFMFAGHDTTSTALQFALMLIGLYPEKQKLIHKEMDTIFEGDIDREITSENIKQMPYLEMCIKETLRLYPPAAFFARDISVDFQCDGHLIPAGTTFIVSSYAIHRDPVVYSNPEHFLPERFSPNSTVARSPFAFIPFSAGLRNCIGQRFAMIELKIFLATILRQYSIRSLTRQEDILIDFSVISKSHTPIQIEFTKRESSREK